MLQTLWCCTTQLIDNARIRTCNGMAYAVDMNVDGQAAGATIVAWMASRSQAGQRGTSDSGSYGMYKVAANDCGCVNGQDKAIAHAGGGNHCPTDGAMSQRLSEKRFV